MEVKYYVSVWTWNGMEYEPRIVYESEDLDEVKKEYEALNADNDHALIELWEIGDDDNNRIDYKEA